MTDVMRRPAAEALLRARSVQQPECLIQGFAEVAHGSRNGSPRRARPPAASTAGGSTRLGQATVPIDENPPQRWDLLIHQRVSAGVQHFRCKFHWELQQIFS